MMALNTNPLNNRGRNSSIIQLLEAFLEVAEFFLQVNNLSLFFHHRHTHTMAHCCEQLMQTRRFFCLDIPSVAERREWRPPKTEIDPFVQEGRKFKFA